MTVPCLPIPPQITAFTDELVSLRRDIHASPELGFEERRTSELVARHLAAFGCEVHTGIGRTGVVGVLRRGSSQRAIGLRADMDALPINEENNFSYRSKRNGVMHACGHDGHTAMLLGAARYLAEAGTFDGTVHFIFQPAEEGLGGAQAMLADALMRRFPCSSLYGMHNWPGMPVGEFGIRPGAMLAGGAFFDITLTGRGAHGAFPHLSHDCVLAAGELTVALQAIVARRVDPVQPAVASITRIRGGDAYNVIPQSVRIGGTARAFDEATMMAIEREMARIAEGVASAHAASAEVDFRTLFAPTINADRETMLIADVAAELVGAERVERNHGLILGSEDFSFMLRERPGAFILIGNGEDTPPPHTPRYDFNDDLIPIGATLFAKVAESDLPA